MAEARTPNAAPLSPPAGGDSAPRSDGAPADCGALRCVVVLGPTATGKTRLGVALARRFGGEIVSADSRQVFRGMDIGTGKDLEEYGPPEHRVPVHLLDIVEPTEEYHLFGFLADARRALVDIAGRGRLPIVVGGSTLYINALLDDYRMEGGGTDPDLRREVDALGTDELLNRLRTENAAVYERTDKTQRKRITRALEIARSVGQPRAPSCPPLAPLLLGPHYPRPAVHARIAARLDARLAGGLIEEVAALHARGISWERLDYFGLEYRCVAQHLQGQLTIEQLRDVLAARIRQFCRRQDIWFRKMEREGKSIHWLPRGDVAQAASLVERFLHGLPLPAPAIRLKDIHYGPKSSRQRTGGSCLGGAS